MGLGVRYEGGAEVFCIATPANIMKFDATEPGQGMFNFTGAEEFLEIVERGRKLVRWYVSSH